MKLICFSDLHGNLPQASTLWKADVAVIAGDVVPAWTTFHVSAPDGLIKQVAWAHDTFIPWLNTLPVKDIVMTWGNHDWVADQKGGSLIPNAWWPDHLHLLVNSGATIDGVHFYGVPQTPRFFDWAFNEDDTPQELGKRWDAVDPETDVLVTHGPPHMVCDWVGYKQGTRAGSRTQRAWLLGEGPRPKMTICGHIHSAGGESGKIVRSVEGRDSTTIYNVACVNEKYNLVRGPKVVPL